MNGTKWNATTLNNPGPGQNNTGPSQTNTATNLNNKRMD